MFLFVAESFLESVIPVVSNSPGKHTADATSGPMRAPHPASSTPAIIASSKLKEYFQDYGTDIISWSHIRCRCRRASLKDLIHHICDLNPQVVYLNDPDMSRSDEFAALLRLLTETSVWAINLGEIEFSSSQCTALTAALERSQIAFMFVDAVFVGSEHVLMWKKILRERRRETEDARWLLTDDVVQNRVIKACKNMWWSPMALGRNKTKADQLRAATLISRREAGDVRRDSIGDARRDSGDARRDTAGDERRDTAGEGRQEVGGL